MYALLVREPFNMSFEEIAKLTDRQLISVVFHPRDKEGMLELDETTGDGVAASSNVSSIRDVAYMTYRARGMAPEAMAAQFEKDYPSEAKSDDIDDETMDALKKQRAEVEEKFKDMEWE